MRFTSFRQTASPRVFSSKAVHFPFHEEILADLVRLGFLSGFVCKEVTVEGLIIPRDNDGMYVRNPDGQFEIEWTKETKVALEVNTRLFKGLKGNVLHYQVQASKEVLRFTLPKGPVTGIVGVRSKGQLPKRLKEAHEENWIGEHGLRLFFGESRPQQMASPDDLRFIGLWDQAPSRAL